MYYVYMLRCDDNSLYTGTTNDFNKRYQMHVSKSKDAAKYTKSRNVTKAEALWLAPDKSSALKLEIRIKRLKKAKKEQLVNNPCLVADLGLECEYIPMAKDIRQML